MVWQALKVARTQKPNLSTIWLKISNAYESIPNKPILFILHRYGVSLHSGSDLLKQNTQVFSINHFLNQ